MNIIKYPARADWKTITVRPHIDMSKLNATVSEVLNDIRANGDEAVKRYEQKFDHVELHELQVSESELHEAQHLVSDDLRQALMLAHDNIRKFHEAQAFRSIRVQTAPGVECWQKSVAIEKVGLYIPGGTAPLFSTVLMLATPAKIAGCKEIVLCTPPDSTGHVNPAILVAAHIAGVSRIYKIGGVQAIGAMAYGTESVPKVSKIFGPGNQYVMAAKQHVSLGNVAIDMPARPSEVCVIADDTSNPRYVAADLLSQAEHGVDSQVLLISTSEPMLYAVQKEVETQLQALPRKEIAAKTLENSKLVLVRDADEAMDLSNAYAPEHLIIATHPHQAVNRNALLAACERRVEKHVASAFKAEQGRLQAKQDRRIRAQHVVVYLARKAEHVAHRIENAFILGYGITAEVWQRRTLSHTLAVGLFGRGYGYEPRLACGVDAPRCSCRLFKMQRARFYGHMISHYFFFSL